MDTSVRLGDVELLSVTEYEGNPMPLHVMFENATEADLTQLVTWFDDERLAGTLRQSVVELTWRTWVLRAPGWIALVDTGLGNDKTRVDPIDFCDHLSTPYLASMAEIGVAPGDVDTVICTHLHFDHVGWNTTLTDGVWVPTFPNARYLLPAADLVHFASADGDHITFPSYVDSVRPLVDRGVVDEIAADAAPLWHGELETTFRSVPGHSPGSMLVGVRSGAQRVWFVGDLMHHPIQLVNPELSLGVEEHPSLSSGHRRRFLDEVADTDDLIAPAHFPGSGLGRIVTSTHGRGYEWVPVS